MKLTFFTDFFELIKNFATWLKENRTTPEGRAVLFAIGLSITVGVAGSFMAYNKGRDDQEIKDLAKFEKQDVKIVMLENKVDTLQTRFATRDCTDDIRRWKSIFENLYSESSDKVSEVELERNRELREAQLSKENKRQEQEKTKELINIKNKLK